MEKNLKIKTIAISKQLILPHFLGFVNHSKRQSKEKVFKIY